MKKDSVRTIKNSRVRESKTNYKVRRRLLESRKPRLVVRVSSRNTIAQIVEYVPEGDKIIVAASSKMLAKTFGYKGNLGNISSSYLTGMLIAKKALKAGVEEAILDIGNQTSVKGSRIYAALKGAVDGGLDVPHSEDVLPSDERIAGKHIAEHAKSMKKDDAAYKKYFASYIKAGTNPESLPEHFESVKKKIEGL